MDLPTFRSTFPEFINTALYPDALVDAWLQNALLRMDSDPNGFWSTQAMLDMAQGWLTAHYLIVSQNSKAGQQVSVKAGTTSVSFAPQGVNSSSLASTSYGKEYLGLLRRQKGGPIVVNQAHRYRFGGGWGYGGGGTGW